jgi:hypothetical protein
MKMHWPRSLQRLGANIFEKGKRQRTELNFKGASMTIGGYRIKWFDVFVAICGISCSAAYAWYVGDWLKGMSIGMLSFILGWMTMEWFILGDDDFSSATDRAQSSHCGGAVTETWKRNTEEPPSLKSKRIAMESASQTGAD